MGQVSFDPELNCRLIPVLKVHKYVNFKVVIIKLIITNMQSTIDTIIFGSKSASSECVYIGNVTCRTATEASVHTVAVLRVSDDLVGVRHHFTFCDGTFESDITICPQSGLRTPELRSLIENILDVAMSKGGRVGTFLDGFIPGFSGRDSYTEYVDKYFDDTSPSDNFNITVRGEMIAKNLSRERFGQWTVIFDDGGELLDHPMPVPTQYHELFDMAGEMMDPSELYDFQI